MTHSVWGTVRRCLGGGRIGLLALFILVTGLIAGDAFAQKSEPLPGSATGYNIEFWRAVRGGVEGTVSIPDTKAGVLVQAEGDVWRTWRNGPVSYYGGWALLIMTSLLVAFFVVRGRIRIDAGRSKRRITRFGATERFGHWLVAVSFLTLAASGLNMLYGKTILLPVLGAELFATMTLAGKYLHNYLAFAFIGGLLVIFVTWVRHNLPSRTDLEWIVRGGGLLMAGSHPPAKKFNFGQKLIFWSVIVGGIMISLTGISLMFPFELPLVSSAFAALNGLGFRLPAELSVLQEMQYTHVWHTVVALSLIVIMIAHIYIGTIGMEGAFDAVGSGDVDENWAREHHSLWVEDLKKTGVEAGKATAE